ncbi:MAG: hypothetical protein II007_01180 [Gammaproteobacteria bacterium]|nr:hypothetical protein [Gammaproteobacteria bacterium]
MDKLIKGLGAGLVLLALTWFGAQFYTQYRVDQLLAQIPTSIAKIGYKRVTALPWGELRFRDLTLNAGRHQFSAAEASVPLVLFDWWPRELTLKADNIIWRDSYESGEVASALARINILGDRDRPTISGELTATGIRLPAEAWGLDEDQTRLVNWAAGWTGIPGTNQVTFQLAPSQSRFEAITELDGLYRTEQRLVASGWQELFGPDFNSVNPLLAINAADRVFMIDLLIRWQDLGLLQRLETLRHQQDEVAEILRRDEKRIAFAAKVMRAQRIDNAEALALAVADTAKAIKRQELRMRPLAPVPLAQPLHALAMWNEGKPELLATQAVLFGLEMETELAAETASGAAADGQAPPR